DRWCLTGDTPLPRRRDSQLFLRLIVSGKQICWGLLVTPLHEPDHRRAITFNNLNRLLWRSVPDEAFFNILSSLSRPSLHEAFSLCSVALQPPAEDSAPLEEVPYHASSRALKDGPRGGNGRSPTSMSPTFTSMPLRSGFRCGGMVVCAGSGHRRRPHRVG